MKNVNRNDEFLPPDLLERVTELAKEEKRMPSAIVAEALELYLQERRIYRQIVADRKKPYDWEQSAAQMVETSNLLSEVNDVAEQENRTAGELMREAARFYLDARRAHRQA